MATARQRAEWAIKLATHRIDPTPAIARIALRRWTPPSATVLSIYRRRNADVVMTALAPAVAASFDVRLWALDEPSASLSKWTEGSGPGGRLALVNILLAQRPHEGYVVLVDDDVVFPVCSLVDAVRLTAGLGLDLAQPAHELGSMHSHKVTRAVPFTLARRTTFVEVGPVVIVAPTIQGDILPFAETTPMGWGVDTQWSDLQRTGFEFGVLDAVRVRHRGSVGEDYANLRAEHAAGLRAEAERGLESDWRRTVSTIGLRSLRHATRPRSSSTAGVRPGRQ